MMGPRHYVAPQRKLAAANGYNAPVADSKIAAPATLAPPIVPG
jgi:hypothetical protein